MATHYLYGTILTTEAVAANNRGDNIGNTTTLQKVFLGDDLHTSVSAEAIRFAIRYRFQLQGLGVNRTYDPDEGKLHYQDEKRNYWKPNGNGFQPLVDDDLMGFMDAEAAKKEQEAELMEELSDEAQQSTKDTKGGRKPKGKGKTFKRQSPLAVGRAVSLRPYRGEISFNCVSGEKEKGRLSLYSAEMHTTEYQYTFGLNLNDVFDKASIAHLIDAIVDMPSVAGNHARFAYDFSPASIICRLTSCHSPKIQNCFEHDEETRGYTLDRLMRRVESGDVPAAEVVVGGLVCDTEWGTKLRKAGATVEPGVVKAAEIVKQRIAELGAAYIVVRNGRGA